MTMYEAKDDILYRFSGDPAPPQASKNFEDGLVFNQAIADKIVSLSQAAIEQASVEVVELPLEDAAALVD